MQRIERYGVIALLLLLVTVLAVSMWGEEAVDPKDSSTHTLASVTPARRETGTRRQTPTRTTGQNAANRRNSQVESGVPLSTKTRPVRVQPRSTQVTNTQPRNLRNSRPSGTDRRNTTVKSPGNNANRDFTLANSGSNAVKRVKEPVVQPTQNPGVIQNAANLVVTKTSELVDKFKPSSSRDKTPTRAKTWTVKSGETLSEISQEALGSATLWRNIVAANPGIDPNRLSVGTKLVLPTGASVAVSTKPFMATEPTQKPRAAASAGGTYTVQPGDVLSKIAQRELGSANRWREIVSLNPSVDPDRLAVGAKLVLPTGRATHAHRPVATNSLAVVRAKKPSAKGSRVR